MDLMAYVFNCANDAGLTARRLPSAAAGAVASTEPGETTAFGSWAVVRWDPDSPLPRSEVPVAAHRHAATAWFWSLVLGVTFSIPALGAELGNASGLESEVLTAAGIHDGFLNRLRDEVTPGRSALLLLSGPAGALGVEALIHQRELPVVAHITFTARQEAALLDVLS
jgi:uncharacterized membrane protein